MGRIVWGAAIALGIWAASSVASESGTTRATAVAPNVSVNSECLESVRPQDELWTVNTRELCGGDNPEQMRYAKRTGEGEWKSSDQKAFRAAAAGGRVRIWVHGYAISEGVEHDVGMAAYRRMVAADEPPLKFLIWSWPGDRERHRLRDIRQKGVRTNVEGYYLGWLMAHLDAKTDVSISGYSYGARIVTGGLHVLGGGELYGMQLPKEMRSAAGSRSYRAVLLAPAIDNQWLAADEYHGMALSQTSSMLSIYSSCDSVLKWYRFAVCDRRAQALGYTGISSLPPRTGDENKFSQLDVCCNGIGSEHDWQVYLASGAVTSAAREVLCRTNAK